MVTGSRPVRLEDWLLHGSLTDQACKHGADAMLHNNFAVRVSPMLESSPSFPSSSATSLHPDCSVSTQQSCWRRDRHLISLAYLPPSFFTASLLLSSSLLDAARRITVGIRSEPLTRAS